MKKQTLISVALLVVGFLFEYLHFQTNSTFLGLKLWLVGIISIIVGSISLWIYTIMPLLDNQIEREDSSS